MTKRTGSRDEGLPQKLLARREGGAVSCVGVEGLTSTRQGALCLLSGVRGADEVRHQPPTAEPARGQ